MKNILMPLLLKWIVSPFAGLRGSAVGLALALLTMPLSPASAYNQDTHQRLVDYAWQVMLTIDVVARGTAPPDLPFRTLQVSGDFSKRVQRAIGSIRKLPSNLPPPQDSRCVNPASIQKLGTNTPDWDNQGDFFNTSLERVRYPIVWDYEAGRDCGVDLDWSAGGIYSLVNSSDYTGTVLGYWALYPDTLLNDFHVGVKATSTGGMSFLKEALVAAGAIPAATVWVPVKCAWKCLKSVVSLSPGECGDCCKDAVNTATGASRDAVSGIDSLVPIIGDIRNDAIVGMSHHINVPLANTDYDDISGLLITRAGPFGVPGVLETLATAVADVTGATVRYDDSAAPKNYDVRNAQDGSPDSTHRDAADWQFLPFPHITMPPVDNLGLYGIANYEMPPGRHTKFLGFALHAIADATVPMHVAGAFGWGHRPYEEAVAAIQKDLLAANSRTEPDRLNNILLPRAEAYYKIITLWREANPAHASGIPVRLLVTEVARQTWAMASANPGIFSDDLSMAAVTPAADLAIKVYASNGTVLQQYLDEAVAASIAFLVAAGEVLP